MIQLQSKGHAKNIYESFIGVLELDSSSSKGYLVRNRSQTYVLSSGKPEINKNLQGVFEVNTNNLRAGDIVLVTPNGSVNTLYRINSEDNAVFMTNKCNQNCIMCSQPPSKNEDIEHLFKINSELIGLIPNSVSHIGITGGEPTLCGDFLGEIILKLRERNPEIFITILTNGILLSEKVNLKHFGNENRDKLLFSIPIYGDNEFTHDSIVGHYGSFYKTIKALHNLSQGGFRVELRIIPQRLNVERLYKLSHFIYRNLTFVERVVFMALENIGNARKNLRQLWIEPKDLILPLEMATSFLLMSGINCYLYNFQYCLLSEKLKKLSVNSISDWKVEFLPECNLCMDKTKCGGMFFSSIGILKNYIRPNV
jgi:His-Xaa-Ser system radical SAM maturase HxsC